MAYPNDTKTWDPVECINARDLRNFHVLAAVFRDMALSKSFPRGLGLEMPLVCAANIASSIYATSS
jgi:hypothetical protein